MSHILEPWEKWERALQAKDRELEAAREELAKQREADDLTEGMLRSVAAERDAAREENRKLREALTRIAEDDMTRAEPNSHFILRDDGATYPDDAPQFTYTRDTPRSLARAALRAEEPKP